MATFVVCHGAWSAAWAWKKVRPLLRAAGHEIFTPTYTGLGERAHQVSRAINLETHIDDVLAVLECEDLRDVVLVGHSYGGMVATGVADRAAERIAKLIYLDAFVPENGQSAFDLLPASARASRQEAARAQGDGWLLPPNPTPPDTSPEDVAWITPRRRWQPIGTFSQPLVLRNAGAACRATTSTARASRPTIPSASLRAGSGRTRHGNCSRSMPATARTSRRPKPSRASWIRLRDDE